MYPRIVVIVEPGAQADADRVVLRSGGHRLSGQFGARTDDRRQCARRSCQDRMRRRRGLAGLDARRHGRGQGQLQGFCVHHRRRGGAQSDLRALWRRGQRRRDRRRQPAQGPPARRQYAGDQPRRRRLREPRALQIGARRRKPRHLPGQDHRRAARAEDRRQDDDAGAAAVRRRRKPTTSRNWKSSPTTWSAATAPPPARSIRA